MLTICAIVAVSLAAPVPKAVPPTLYFPTTVGTKWVYDCAGEESTLIVTAVEDKDGAKIVSVAVCDEKQNKVWPRETVIVTEKGLQRVSTGGAKLDQPICLLRMPFRADESWDVENRQNNRLLSAGISLPKRPEGLKVPAGVYQAIRIDQIKTAVGGRVVAPKDRRIEQTVWYAPKVGVVKIEYPGGEPLVLKSFTPGKEAVPVK